MSKNKKHYKDSNNKHKNINSQKHKGSVLKNFAMVLLALIITVCFGIDIWYFWIVLFGPEKITSTTLKVDFQVSADGNKEPAIEIKYFSNENKNGLECYEVKYNYMMDENKSQLISKGIQYTSLAKNTSNSLSWIFYKDPSSADSNVYKTDKKGWGLTQSKYHNAFGTFEINNSFNKKEYQSADNFKTVINSVNPIDSSNGFKWEMGSDIYEVKFRKNNDYYDSKVKEEKKEAYLNNTYQFDERVKWDYYMFYDESHYNTYHCIYDVNYLNKTLYESLDPVKNGGTQTLIYELPDIFDYYKYDKESKNYSEVRETDSTKLTNEINNYYAIRLTILKDGITKASESLFGTVDGNSTFNLTDDYEKTDYFVGRAVIDVSINDFDLIKNNETYDLLLNEAFIKKYGDYKSNIFLNLNLDYSNFEKQNLHVNEPTKQSLQGFKVYKLNINKTYY